MEFNFTPEEAQTAARAIVAEFRRRKFKVDIEVPVAEDVPFRPTMCGRKGDFMVLIEVHGQPQYSAGLRDLVRWASVNRAYAEIYLGTTDQAPISGSLLRELQKEGVGLISADEAGVIATLQGAWNHALVVSPDPTLRLGRCKKEVVAAVQGFNVGDRKANLQGMCEAVERETDGLARALARKGWIDKNEAAVRGMDWATQINVIAASDRYVGGRTPVVTQTLKDDLHSFRGARNLIDHKARTKQEERAREQQFVERMMMGPRLLANLLTIQRRVR
jgi:hypothetical protein